MLKYKPYVIALDLEGTLISNAVSQFSRPGLYKFLEYCYNNFCRIVIFTAVSELHFRSIAALANLGKVPSWFVNLEYINWDKKYKDLSFIPGIKPTEVILIDDREEYIKQEQKKQWIYIPGYEYPYPEDDDELDRVIQKLSHIN